MIHLAEPAAISQLFVARLSGLVPCNGVIAQNALQPLLSPSLWMNDVCLGTFYANPSTPVIACFGCADSAWNMACIDMLPVRVNARRVSARCV